MTARVLSVAVLLGLAPTAFAQKLSAADLALQSRAILLKRCGECHGDQPGRTQLNVLDYTTMVSKRGVPFIRAKEPDASQALELIEQGSMPPGRHPKVPEDEVDVLRKWVSADAGAYPLHFDDAYVYDAILADLAEAPARDVPHYRYLTLHHLAEDAATTDFFQARADFLRDLPKVFVPMWGGPQPVGAHATVFRIDLRDAGWDLKPFVKVDSDGKDNGESQVNVFDVVLLEYPYLRLPSDSPAFEKIAAKFLKPAKQVRPAPFVRGDWFVQATTTTRLGQDLGKLLNLGDNTPPGLKGPKSETAIKSKPLAGALRAVDAWYGPDPVDEPAIKGLKVETTADWPTVPGLMVQTIDFSRNMPRDKFYGGERFRLRISADVKMYFQLVWIDAKNGVSRWPPPEKYETPGKAWEAVLPDVDDVLDPKELGTEKLMVFASIDNFPTIEALRARKGEVERFYHLFFELKASANGFAPDLAHAKVTRRTATITVLDPKLKK
jgi:mono/diheme cytochrome c family protein